jgi:hypothetical protein
VLRLHRDIRNVYLHLTFTHGNRSCRQLTVEMVWIRKIYVAKSVFIMSFVFHPHYSGEERNDAYTSSPSFYAAD